MNVTETTTVEQPPHERRWIDVAAWIVITWVLAALGPFSVFVPVAVCWVLYRLLAARRFLGAGLFTLMMPLGLSAVMAVADYGRGNVRLRDSGLPEMKFYNLDPEWRCGRTTSGCIVDGSEWITQLPYNTTAKWLIACFGYMPGTYLGPYPTEKESQAALANAPAISADELEHDRIVIDGEAIQLDDGVGTQLLKKLRYSGEWWTPESIKDHPIRAVVWKEECVLVRIPWHVHSDDEVPAAAIALFSRATGRPFAFYGEGQYSHYRLPVNWKR